MTVMRLSIFAEFPLLACTLDEKFFALLRFPFVLLRVGIFGRLRIIWSELVKHFPSQLSLLLVAFLEAVHFKNMQMLPIKNVMKSRPMTLKDHLPSHLGWAMTEFVVFEL